MAAAALILLDRDGVINEDSDNFVRSAEQWQPIPGSIEAIAKLKQAGFKVAVATNQSGIARGLYDIAELERMHQKFSALLAAHQVDIDAIEYCPHGPDEGCDCRKPLPGLLHRIEQQLGCSVVGCDLVGDSLRDLQAATAAGALPVLVLTGKGQKTLKQLPADHQIPVFDNLAAYAEARLNSSHHGL